MLTTQEDEEKQHNIEKAKNTVQKKIYKWQKKRKTWKDDHHYLKKYKLKSWWVTVQQLQWLKLERLVIPSVDKDTKATKTLIYCWQEHKMVQWFW